MAEITRSEAAQIAEHCHACGVPHLAAGFLGEGLSLDEVKARVSAAGKAQEIVALARKKDASIPADLAATMLAEGKTVEEIRTAVFAELVASEEKTSIASHVPAAHGSAGHAASQGSMRRTLQASGITPTDEVEA